MGLKTKINKNSMSVQKRKLVQKVRVGTYYVKKCNVSSGKTTYCNYTKRPRYKAYDKGLPLGKGIEMLLANAKELLGMESKEQGVDRERGNA